MTRALPPCSICSNPQPVTRQLRRPVADDDEATSPRGIASCFAGRWSQVTRGAAYTRRVAAADTPHPSNSEAQVAAEWAILYKLGITIDVALNQGSGVPIGVSEVKPDGAALDNSVFVEVFAHIGPLKGGQKHKVSTDALKLLAIREVHPKARLILAFADEEAARSVSGWKAATLETNKIEIRVVELDPEDRAKIEAAQARQRMVNP